MASARDPSTRQRFIDATLELIDEVGVDRVRLHDVLKRSGLSNGSLYWFFKNRRSLIDAALAERYVRRLRSATREARRRLDDQSSAERIEEFLAPLIQPFTDDLATVRAERIAVLAGALADSALAGRVAEMQQELLDGYASVIRSQQQAGFLRNDIEAEAIAQLIQVVAVGLASLDLVADDEAVADRWSSVAAAIIGSFRP